MNVTLLHSSPLDVVVQAIRKCYASEGKSDSGLTYRTTDGVVIAKIWVLGPKDKALIQRIIESDHTSTLEHLVFTFDIDGLSRAALQEHSRHRIASESVKSTRYTMGEIFLGSVDTVDSYVTKTGNEKVDKIVADTLRQVHEQLSDVPNDLRKYALPEAVQTSLLWTVNARSLRNFLSLRSSKRALWEMQELAAKVFAKIPAEMQFIFSDCMEG